MQISAASSEHKREDYDSADDLTRSIEFAYQAIRDRVAAGGPGWRGFPGRNRTAGEAGR